MDIWPAALTYKPVMDGYGWRPHDLHSRVPMEQGPARKRRRWKDSPAFVTPTWKFTRNEFELFRAWHHVTLGDGEAWFRMPVWTGAAYADCPCKFARDYEPSPAGMGFQVAAEIEVRQVPYTAVETVPAIGLPEWPEMLEPLPMRDGLGMAAPSILRSNITPGPVASKQWFEDGPANLTQSWAFTGGDFELFRSWYHHGLKDGIRWFNAPAWVGGWFGDRRLRFVDDYQATLSKGLWTISTKLDVREVPYLDDGAAFLLGVLGEVPLVDFADGFHDFLHHTYEA